jgi:hypothetical protein
MAEKYPIHYLSPCSISTIHSFENVNSYIDSSSIIFHLNTHTPLTKQSILLFQRIILGGFTLSCACASGIPGIAVPAANKATAIVAKTRLVVLMLFIAHFSLLYDK